MDAAGAERPRLLLARPHGTVPGEISLFSFSLFICILFCSTTCRFYYYLFTPGLSLLTCRLTVIDRKSSSTLSSIRPTSATTTTFLLERACSYSVESGARVDGGHKPAGRVDSGDSTRLTGYLVNIVRWLGWPACMRRTPQRQKQNTQGEAVFYITFFYPSGCTLLLLPSQPNL